MSVRFRHPGDRQPRQAALAREDVRRPAARGERFRRGRRLGPEARGRRPRGARRGPAGKQPLEVAEIDDWAAIYAIRLLEQVGLDVVYDGEQKRTEMYDHVAAFANGFEPRGIVRSFDNKYYAKAAVVEPPRWRARRTSRSSSSSVPTPIAP